MRRLAFALALLAAVPASWAGSNNTPGTTVGCVYNTSLPTMTDNQAITVQCDSSGRQLIAGTVIVTPSGTQDVNLTKVGGTAITLGQKFSVSSLPVVIASDQTSVQVFGTVAVTQSTSPWVVGGTVTANQGGAPWSQNITQIGGGTLALGQTTMAASVPVAIASNQSALTVTGAGGTFPVTQGTSPWIVAGGGTAGAAATGVLTVQGIAAMTPVQVSQATAANLNATVVGTGTFTVQAAQSGNWTTRIVGNGGATVDATVGAGTAPTNMLVGGAIYNSTEISPTTGQSFALQGDSKGRLRGVIMDAAGNTRGANVNASNQLSVSVDAIIANQSMNLAQVGGASVALGQTTMSASIPVALASNQSALPVSESGTWTVQPGNTPNTTAWLTQNSPSAAAAAGVAPVSSTALEANRVIKASAGNLYSFEVMADSTLSAAAWWILVFNATSAPADGAVTPAKCYSLPSGATGASYGFASVPLYLGTGITISASTTGCFTKTASAHAFISGDAQ